MPRKKREAPEGAAKDLVQGRIGFPSLRRLSFCAAAKGVSISLFVSRLLEKWLEEHFSRYWELHQEMFAPGKIVPPARPREKLPAGARETPQYFFFQIKIPRDVYDRLTICARVARLTTPVFMDRVLRFWIAKRFPEFWEKFIRDAAPNADDAAPASFEAPGIIPEGPDDADESPEPHDGEAETVVLDDDLPF